MIECVMSGMNVKLLLVALLCVSLSVKICMIFFMYNHLLFL